MTLLLTGATKGIGRALAFEFAPHCEGMALIARTQNDLHQLQTALQQGYPKLTVWIFPCDLSDTKARKATIDAIQKGVGPIDILINNAGRFDQGDLLKEPSDRLQEVLDLNLVAAYDLCRAFVPAMRERRVGHVFNICSVASLQAMPGCGSYVISKHALLGLTRALRQELLDYGVRVTAVLPGATWSASWAGVPFPKDRLMPAEAIAQAVRAAWQMDSAAVVEELVIRPQQGDL